MNQSLIKVGSRLLLLAAIGLSAVVYRLARRVASPVRLP
jgi:hypothetical protein